MTNEMRILVNRLCLAATRMEAGLPGSIRLHHEAPDIRRWPTMRPEFIARWSRRSRRALRLWSLLLLLDGGVSLWSETAKPANQPGVQLTQLPDRIRVEINGALFTEYHFATNASRPFCYPLIGPGGMPMTRNFPMERVSGEAQDHPHHRSLWYAHGDVNGVDFWAEGPKRGRIVHVGFDEIRSGAEVGSLRARNHWLGPDGQLMASDERVLRFHRGDGTARVLDFEITLQAVAGDLKLGDTKEGSMAVRLAETMRLKPNADNVGKPTGHIVNSEGVRDGATWGKRAAWCDYHGPVDAHLRGIAIFDHPQNPRHPTWWHVRDYGLFAANPFGRSDFEQGTERGAGDLLVRAGEQVTFRYRFLLHEGDEQQGRVAAHYKAYLQAVVPPTKP